jgi:hypothetical protein
MGRELQRFLDRAFDGYAQEHRLPAHWHRAVRQLRACRTAQLGGHVQRCPNGHVERVWYNSCRHRSCPQCNAFAAERWLTRQRERLLATAHHHMIFTIPHELNDLWRFNEVRLTALLFDAVRDTLSTLFDNPRILGATPGVLASFHSWGRDLSIHPHVHCLITDGGLSAGGAWQQPRRSHFLPVRVAMLLFRGKLLEKLRRQLAELELPPTQSRFRAQVMLEAIRHKKWNVHLRERYAHGDGVAMYLARYVRGGPLRSHQLRDHDDATISLCFRSHRHGRHQTLRLRHHDFLTRYLVHVPHPRQQLVRGWGLYACGAAQRLDVARQHLGQPPVPPATRVPWPTLYGKLSATGGMHNPTTRCTHCPVCGSALVAGRVMPPPRAGPP